MSEIKINNIPVITENNGSVELTTGAANIGNNALVVDASGNVGVGASSPSEKLHINGTGETILVTPVVYNVNQDSAYLIAAPTSYSGGSTNWGASGFQHRIKSNAGGTARITVDTNKGEAFCIDNNNNVGFGTSSPDANLQIGPGARCANSYIFRPTLLIGDRPYADGNSNIEFSPNLTTGNGVYISVDSSKNFKIGSVTSGSFTEHMRIDSSGRVTMPYQPMFSGGRSAGDVTNAIFVMNDVDQGNVGNHYNASTGIFTCPVAGSYLVGFSIMTSGNKSGTGDAFSIRVNSTNTRNHYRTFNNLGYERIDGNVILNCQANDTIDFYARAYTIYGQSRTHSYGYIGLLG